MSIYKLVIPVICVLLTLTGCTGKPDLVVTRLEATGPATVNTDNSVELPIRAIVENQGSSSAQIFKVATEYTGGAIDPSRSFAVAFTVPGQTDIWYPHTNAPLARGDSVTFAGIATFHPDEHGVTVSLKAEADSCNGDEFMPPHCRVDESDEGNNESASISVSLP